MAENDKVTTKKTVSEKGLQFIKDSHEILRPDDVTEAEATELLKALVTTAENAVNTNVKRTLNQPQFDALVDIAFDMGAEEFAASDLLKKVNEKASAKTMKTAIKAVVSSPEYAINAPERRKHDAMLWTRIRNRWIAGGILLVIVVVIIVVISNGKRKKKKSKKAA